VREKLESNFETGLSSEQVKQRREKFGENKLEEGKKESMFVKFIKQFDDFMVIILIGAAVISAVLSYYEQTNEYIDSIIIIFIVILNAIMGLVQEYKAEKSLEALNKLSAPVNKVKRNGQIMSILSSELVQGDYIIIETGCCIPEDCRLVKSYNLKVEEAILTGENAPVSKNCEVLREEKPAIGDMKNMIFQSTVVVNGHAEAVITETGMNTQVGKIAKMIIEHEAPQTPLQRKLR
jgi:Ca2+-transporting ATPase